MRESKISLTVMVGGVVVVVTGILCRGFGLVLIGGMCAVTGACMCIMDREEKKYEKMTEKEIELWVKRLILFVFFDSVALIALAYRVYGG